MNFNNIKTGVFFLLLLIGLVSCKENELEQITTLKVDRAFSPTGLTAVVINKTGARLTWNKVTNADSYTIEFFANGTLDFSGTPVKKVEGVLFSQAPYTVTGFNGATAYSVRLKAVGKDVGDSKYVTATFTTETEQIFQDIVPAKLTARSVTLNWPAGQAATTLTVNPGNIVHTVTALEVAAGEVTITGLTPKTTYTAVLTLNAAVRGTKIFTTTAELPTGADVVYVAATDDLAAMIQAATTSTRFVILEGTKYNSDVTVTIPGGINISIIGEVATNKPIVSFNQIMLPTIGGKLHFENIELSGYAKGDETTTKRAYIINQNVPTVTEEVSFENCLIRHFTNTPMRLQSTNVMTINNFIVTNCIIEDISDNGTSSGYAFINSNVALGKINNISITNSTFSNLGFGLILHNAASSLSVTIDNNTFYNVIADTRYLIDYNAQTISSGFSFKNNILAKTYSPAGTARGIRAGTTPTTSNNYQASDVIFAGNLIPGITPYTGTSATLFTAPATKNFKIKDDTFAGKSSSGDPRWRL
ncbi:fibronectin type III domain-containing protein [Pedobacter sp. MC2016-14]|uniref:DUF5123 domain-containing protein n=1 Tax=Pedobacter sp. MC2016-14 TaxID=2897327 RepID=UPI001E3E29AF|nr:DUF5123 domain-containing protein [Pedobacter sp. MC2016-14]MCD0488680.1 fibronectin type III domain-containing protein [Pedobacter sp. MC2016-14]